jgi:hypothetical protein
MTEKNVVGVTSLTDALEVLAECMVSDHLQSQYSESASYQSRLAELTESVLASLENLPAVWDLQIHEHAVRAIGMCHLAYAQYRKEWSEYAQRIIRARRISNRIFDIEVVNGNESGEDALILDDLS